jgi:hypothetical protein
MNQIEWVEKQFEQLSRATRKQKNKLNDIPTSSMTSPIPAANSVVATTNVANSIDPITANPDSNARINLFTTD